MPAVVRSEFALALNQDATERGIDPSVVAETIQAAILAAEVIRPYQLLKQQEGKQLSEYHKARHAEKKAYREQKRKRKERRNRSR